MKSVNYPYVDLNFAIDWVTKARKAGKEVSKELLSEAGAERKDSKASVTSGSYKRKQAALSQYGLISYSEKDKGKIIFTDLVEKIVYPSSPMERTLALKEAFLNAKSFNDLYSRLEKGNEYDKSFLESMAIREIKILSAVSKRFLDNFVASAISVDLLSLDEKGMLYVVNDSLNNNENSAQSNPNEEEKVEDSGKLNYSEVKVKLSEGNALIRLPENMSDEDRIKLKGFIDLL